MNSTSKKVRQITDAAAIGAIYCVFLLISRLTGMLLEYDLFFLMPLPIAIYSYKYGFKLGFIPLTATVILSIFICTTPFSSIVYILPSLFIGVLFGGYLVKTNLKPIIVILIITLVSLSTEILSSVVLSKILGIENIFEEIESIINVMGEWLPKLHIYDIDLLFFQAILEGIIPSILIIVALIDSLLIYLLFNIVLFKSKMFGFYAKRPLLSFKGAPKIISVIYIVLVPCFIYSLIEFQTNNTFVHVLFIIIINLFIVLSLGYVYFGMKMFTLIMKYYNKKWGIILIYLFVLIPPLQFVLIIGGLVDSFYELSDKIISKMMPKP